MATALSSASTARRDFIRSRWSTDDPAGADVLDRAQVQLALAGGVLGDVGQPQPVGPVAVKSRWTRSSCAGGRASSRSCRALPERAPPAVLGAQPPRGPAAIAAPARGPRRRGSGTRTLGRRRARRTRRSRGEPRPGRVGTGEASHGSTAAARTSGPGTSPRRGSHRRPAHTAGRSFSGEVRLRQVGRGPAQHLVLLLQQPDPPLGLPRVTGLGLRRARAIPASRSATAIQFVRHDSGIPKSWATCFRVTPLSRCWATRTTSSRNSFG